ncbi:cytochrome C [Geomonas sp. Red69]|uniref:c-type cytochrome n=1 Tax=Geomonas diazotrophica TaxID=2843197 RepID=UPI001C0FEBD7|nr:MULTISPECIES: cytochrome C [Geomonas]MBU5635463.1 cytochrome C [Geomonas diazotrophica]QXE86627.1 cytochrome C [Geomonas nitrogeniifigens]
MRKLTLFMVVAPPLFGAVLFGYILYRGPRMTVQHHVREFQMVLPAPAVGSVSVTPAAGRAPAQAEAAGLANPVPATPAALVQGEVYYGYYCAFCHGGSGAGNGPVGNSYVPRPADLRLPRASYRDGELLRAMLTGIGHEPVLERVVPPAHRWPLVTYLRSLQPSR